MQKNEKEIIKTAQQRIIELDTQVANLTKKANDLTTERDNALKKLAVYERGQKVDKILDILIDEKHYYPSEQRQEKRAYLMDESVNIDEFMKMAETLLPQEAGFQFVDTGKPIGKVAKEDAFVDNLLDRLTRGIYGNGG